MRAEQDNTGRQELSQKVLVMGDSFESLAAACEIADLGFPVLLASKEEKPFDTFCSPSAAVAAKTGGSKELSDIVERAKKAGDKITRLTQANIRAMAGMPGDFTVTLAVKGADESHNVGAVVLGSDLCDQPLDAEYGVAGSPAVMSQEALEAALANAGASTLLSGKDRICVVFLLGFLQKGAPIVFERVLAEIEGLKKAKGGNADVYVVAGDLKLAAEGLDKVYGESREAGSIFFKLEEAPAITLTDKGISLEVYDQALRQTLSIAPDLLVVEDALVPDPENDTLAAALGLDIEGGWLQKENVHLNPVLSNREGVYVVGPARALNSFAGGFLDAKNAALAVSGLLSGSFAPETGVAVVNEDKCATCLTCLRVCPHGAITVDGVARVSPLACRGCGLCASECPMEAIQVQGYADAELEDLMEAAPAAQGAAPKITAFLCKNSAAQAAETAAAFGLPLAENLTCLTVPCAGKVDPDLLLHALLNGADGVMVVSCHVGNCKSDKGNVYASWRVNDIKRRLTDVGMDPARVGFYTLAANMASGFSQAVKEMEQTLAGLAG